MAKELDELEKLEEEARREALPAVEVEPQLAEHVDFDTFCKSDFRVVKVKSCEAVKKSADRQAAQVHPRRRHRRRPPDPLRHTQVVQARGPRGQDPRRHREPAPAQDDGAGEQRYAHLRRPQGEGRGGRQPADARRHAPRRRETLLQSRKTSSPPARPKPRRGDFLRPRVQSRPPMARMLSQTSFVKRGATRSAGLLHLLVAERRGREARRLVGDAADAADAHTAVVGRDRLAGGGHAHGVRAHRAEHTYLGRAFVARGRSAGSRRPRAGVCPSGAPRSVWSRRGPGRRCATYPGNVRPARLCSPR